MCRPVGNDDRSPTTRARRDGTGDYQRNRAILLAPDADGNPPLCALRIRCDGAPATTADHRVAAVHGGTHELSNLVPACASCNSSKQAGTNPAASPSRSRGPTPGIGPTRLA